MNDGVGRCSPVCAGGASSSRSNVWDYIDEQEGCYDSLLSRARRRSASFVLCVAGATVATPQVVIMSIYLENCGGRISESFFMNFPWVTQGRTTRILC